MTKFTSASTIGNSQIQDNGTTVGIGALNASYKFYVNSGNMKLGDDVVSGSLNKLYFGNGTFVYVGEDVTDDRLYLRGGSLAVNINGSLGTNGQVLTSNGTTATWATPTAGAGTVTSVQLAAGTGISLAGTNPITTSGSITVTNSAPNVTTNLSYTGTTSPVTLNSSDGTDVTFTAGSGITLSATGSNMTITSTGGAVTNLSYSALNNNSTPSSYGDYIIIDNSSGADVNLTEGDGIDIQRYASNYAGYKLNQSYAQLSEDANYTAAITTTFGKVNFSTSVTNVITASTTNDNITVSATGTYEISYSLSFRSDIAQDYEFRIHINNTSVNRSQQLVETTDILDYYPISKTYIATLNANDVIDLRAQVDTGGTNTNAYFEAPVLLVKRLK